MGTVRYTVVNGQVIAENRDGVRKTYVPDPSGSTIALLDDKQKITDTFSYSPFGELKSRTGTTPTPFQYIGTRGYYTDPSSRIYVRARTYQPNYARWMTVDPLWPGESAYGYARGNPVNAFDISGLKTEYCKKKPKAPKTTQCGQWYMDNWKVACEACVAACIAATCAFLRGIAKKACIKACVKECENVTKVGTPPKWAHCEKKASTSECQDCCDQICGSRALCVDQCGTACCSCLPDAL